MAEALTIKGGTNDDTITATSNVNAKNVIDAGAGVDIVNVSTANKSNVRDLGAGADKLNITGVTGAGSVTIADFALGTGGDVLSVDIAGAMTLAANIAQAAATAAGMAGHVDCLHGCCCEQRCSDCTGCNSNWWC